MAAVCGCSTTHHVESADREVYSILDEKTPAVPGMDPGFSIEQVAISLDGLPVRTEDEVPEFLGDIGKQAEVGATVISLEKALEIAVKNSRNYQSEKESLYLKALSLTETRQRYTPVFSGHVSGDLSVYTKDVSKMSGKAEFVDGVPDVFDGLAGLTGAPADILTAYADVVRAASDVTGANEPHVAIEQERKLSGSTSLNVGMLMKGGTEIAVGLTSNFLRYLTGDPRVSTSSALVANISQPLLGSKRRTAAETLTQAERDVLYNLRSFTRFRQSFSVEIASSYYRVLQSQDTVRNNWQSYQEFKRNLARAKAEADIDRITQTELGRTQEEELQSRNRWVNAVQSYLDELDNFKIMLGLPTDAKVVLDGKELDELMEKGPTAAPGFTLEDAVEVARAARLDYYTRRDQLDDAERQLKLAVDALQPNLDLVLGANVNSMEGDRFQELDFKRYAWNAGLDLDPKLNRKSVRNRYRAAVISYDSAERGFEEFEDRVKLDVRQSWRALEQALVTYEIQKNSVAVSERRVLELELRREVGEVRALDVIDAQTALVDARNSLSRALVDHTLAYLRLWFDMGILYIKEDGQWEEIGDDQQFVK